MALKRHHPPSWLYLLAWLMALCLTRAVWSTHPAPTPLDSGGSPFDWDGGSYEVHAMRLIDPFYSELPPPYRSRLSRQREQSPTWAARVAHFNVRQETKWCPSLRVPCVYAIHTPAGSYIGRAGRGAKSRFSGHIALLRKGTHHSPALQAAYDRHGEASLWLEVMSLDPDEEANVARRFKGVLLNAQSFEPETLYRQMRTNFLRGVPTHELYGPSWPVVNPETTT